MDELKRISIFARVVEAKSFSDAARQLGIAKSAVSKHISVLEKDIGIRLLNRSTRSLSLTEAGEIFYKHCLTIIQHTEHALEELRHYQDQPTGTLRISSPVEFGTTQIVPVVKQLRLLYPALKIELLFDDCIINIIEENIDIAIRIGWMKDSSLVARKLCSSRMVTFAAPDYLSQYGTPTTPKDLAQHNWINLCLFNAPLRWTYKKDQTQETIQMQSEIKTNSVQTVVSLVKSGQGISAIAEFVISEALENGSVIRLLPDHTIKPIGIHAVYPHRDHVPPKVRVFIDALSKHCQQASWAML